MKSLRFITIALLSLSIANSPLFAQWALMKADAEVLIRKGTNHIYNTEFDSASACFNKVITMYPEHPVGYFLDAMVDWWRMQIDKRNQSYHESFLYKVDRELQVCDKMLEKNEFDIVGLFFKGGALGYRGRYYATNQSWLKAANDAREAFDILIRCSQMAPGNHDIMLGTGIYNYFAAALPEKYSALKAVMVFLPDGDKKLGLLQLEAAAKKAKFAAVEAKVVLQQVYSRDFEKNSTEYLRISQELYSQYPKNSFFHRKYATALVSVGSLDSAEVHWRRILDGYRTKAFGYDAYAAREALYYIGYFLFGKGKYDEALPYFYKCDEACRLLDQDPSGYISFLNLYVGKIYDIQGKRDMAIAQYNKIIGWNYNTDCVNEAKQYLQTAYKR